jgi:hypothetical protein
MLAEGESKSTIDNRSESQGLAIWSPLSGSEEDGCGKDRPGTPVLRRAAMIGIDRPEDGDKKQHKR